MIIRVEQPSSLSGKVVFSSVIESRRKKQFSLFFEYSARLVSDSSAISAYFDTNYALGSLLARYLRENFTLPFPVSPLLRKQLPETMSILDLPPALFLQRWYSQLFAKEQEVRLTRLKSISASGQYFTLGLDSFYTLLCLKKRPKYLIFIDGYDVSLSETELSSRVHKTINSIARSLNCSPVFIRTNLREFSEQFFSWEKFHGVACAAATYPLYSILNEVYSNNIKTLDPLGNHWGTSAIIDPLYSTEYISIRSFGHQKNRFEKALELSRNKHFDLVLKNVRTCWRNKNKGPTEFNCCRCEKCARTYLSLVAATGNTFIPAFKNFSLENLDDIEFHYNPETKLSWRSIHEHLIRHFGKNSAIAKKAARFNP